MIKCYVNEKRNSNNWRLFSRDFQTNHLHIFVNQLITYSMSYNICVAADDDISRCFKFYAYQSRDSVEFLVRHNCVNAIIVSPVI